MATPFVAGVALLMRDADPGLSPQQVKDGIMRTAVDWGRGDRNQSPGTTGPDVDYGAGRLDAYAALAAAGADLTSPPPMPAHLLREGTLPAAGSEQRYELRVTDTSLPIAATLVMAGVKTGDSSDPDFNLELYDPSGARVAAADSLKRQEELGYKPQVPGTYRLRVVSFRGSGPFFVDISAAIDNTAPTATITGGPSGTTTAPDATFEFSSSEAGSMFECRLDAGGWEPCASPRTYGGLGEGPHAFEVRATDRAGNVGPPARREWTRAPATSPATPAAPDITLLGRSYARRSGRGRVTVHTRARVTCPAASPGACTVSGRLRGRVRSSRTTRTVLLTLGRRSLRVAAGRSAVLTIRLSRRAAREIARKRRIRASLTITAASAGAERAVLRRTTTVRLRR